MSIGNPFIAHMCNVKRALLRRAMLTPPPGEGLMKRAGENLALRHCARELLRVAYQDNRGEIAGSRQINGAAWWPHDHGLSMRVLLPRWCRERHDKLLR